MPDRISRVAVSCAVILVAETGAAVLAQAQQTQTSANEAAAFAAYRRDSRLVQIPNRQSMNLYCMGTAAPTVVLEAGIGQTAFTWWTVQERIAKLTRVCAYDRAGLGLSTPGPLPRDTKSEVADLEALLQAADIRPPYVLVGHSMGGYNVRLFASRRVKDVAGIVLIDPSVENQVPILERAAPAIAENDRKLVGFIRYCANPDRSAEAAARCARQAPATFPSDLAAAYAEGHGLQYFQTFLSEMESFLTVASQQVGAERRPLGAMPFVVLTRGELSSDLPADQAAIEWKLWNQMHDDLAKLSTAASNRVVKGANHFIHVDKPDVVVDAVTEVVASARRQQKGGT
jgi:pimeloyl-ACP methyl ester carboxylesterase